MPYPVEEPITIRFDDYMKPFAQLVGKTSKKGLGTEAVLSFYATIDNVATQSFSKRLSIQVTVEEARAKTESSEELDIDSLHDVKDLGLAFQAITHETEELAWEASIPGRATRYAFTYRLAVAKETLGVIFYLYRAQLSKEKGIETALNVFIRVNDLYRLHFMYVTDDELRRCGSNIIRFYDEFTSAHSLV